MHTVEQIVAAGGEVVAGRVIFQQKFVEGVFTADGFSQADGGPLAEPGSKLSKKKATTLVIDDADFTEILKDA